MEKKDVKFIRVKGRIIPIKNKDKLPDSKKKSFVMGTSGKKIKSKSGLKKQGKEFTLNIGYSDALNQAAFLKDDARGHFKEGIKSQLKEGQKGAATNKKLALGATAISALGLLSKSFETKKTSLMAGVVSLAAYKLSDIAEENQKEAEKTLDKDIEKREKSWSKFFKKKKNGKK